MSRSFREPPVLVIVTPGTIATAWSSVFLLNVHIASLVTVEPPIMSIWPSVKTPTPAVPVPLPGPSLAVAASCEGAVGAEALPAEPTLLGFFCLAWSGCVGASTTTGGSGVTSSAVTSPPDVMAGSCAMADADMTRLIAAQLSATYANLDTENTPQYAIQNFVISEEI
jgi:hypothetical protein